MRAITLHTFADVNSAEVIKAVISRPAQGATIDAISLGCRVLDAIDRNAGATTLSLEDADHAYLVGVLKEFRFGMVSRDLLTIVNSILNAPVPTDAARA